MWAKVMLALLCGAMIASALYFDPVRERTLLGTKPADGPRLRLMTWNIGYASLESDSRAHTSDLKAVAETILDQDPDAVALQELTGPEQMNILLGYLNRRYRGSIASLGSADRAEAILTKDREARFENISSGDHYAVSAAFHLRKDLPEIVVVSAHADAFNAARRREFTGDVVDWARGRGDDQLVFIAGDFNFEVTAKNQANLYTDNLKNDSESYSYMLKYFRDLGRDAGPTAVGARRIDYIFGQPEATLLRRAEALKNAPVGRMDHMPLVVEVAL